MPTEAQIEAGAAALFAFGFPESDPAQAWVFLSDEYKPLYRAKAKAVLAAVANTEE